MIKDEFETIKSDLDILENWEDRYRYIIECGQMIEKMPANAKNETNRIQGCASQVWLAYETQDENGDIILNFKGESDAHIVQGLVAIAIRLFSGATAAEISKTSPKEIFQQLGLEQHLSTQRSNGLKSLLQRIEDIARHYA